MKKQYNYFRLCKLDKWVFCKCFNKIFAGVIKMVCIIAKSTFVFANIKSTVSHHDTTLTNEDFSDLLLKINSSGFRTFIGGIEC